MTPHEERLVLELHSQWGNRWSRIARKLPGRTDNEIKNYWRTHMRKKAQEKKRVMSPTSLSSNCCSSLSNNPTMGTLPSSKIGEGSFHDKSGSDTVALPGKKGEEEEEGEKGYSMDEIWKDIALSEENTIKPVYDCYNEEGCNFSCPPMTPPLWDYCSDSLWRMGEEEESKMFPPISDQFLSYYEQGIARL